ncbi:MAG: hypothetical protein KatS3mg068_1500 [Candidatus Sericytochromatia bacterium]|nr:MAG: hypothetical protein KatS3mg068_1500 [Candidatus Sericytochromatia bacterium]
MLKFVSEKLKFLQNGIPLIIAQYHPLAFLNRNIPFWKSLLTMKIFATKVFPEEVSYEKKMNFFNISSPGMYEQVVGFIKAESDRYKFKLNLARINEFNGVMPEIEFFRGFLKPQKVENDFLSVLGTGLDQSFRKNSFIEPPKALIIGIDGFLPLLFHVESVDLKFRDYNTYNFPTIAEVNISLVKIPNNLFDTAKESFDKFFEMVFSVFVSDLRNWTVDRKTYQGNVFGLLIEFMDSFERTGISSQVINVFNGLFGDSDVNNVDIDEASVLTKIYQLTNDVFLADMVSKKYKDFVKYGGFKNF